MIRLGALRALNLNPWTTLMLPDLELAPQRGTDIVRDILDAVDEIDDDNDEIDDEEEDDDDDDSE